MTFVSSACLIAAKTPNNVLNRNDKSRHPCLVPNVRGEESSLSALSTMFTLGVSYMAFLC